MSLFDHDDFWGKLNDDINNAVYLGMGQRLIVDAIEANLVRLKDIRDQPAGVAPYIGFEVLAPGDSVWVEPVGRIVNGSVSRYLSWVVVGKIDEGASSARSLRGVMMKFVGGMDLAGYADAEATNLQWSIDGSSGNAAFGVVNAASFNTPVGAGDSQTSSDTGSTTSTTVWSDAISVNLALPVGTWEVRCWVWIDLLHSAAGRGHVRAMIDEDTGGDFNSPTCSATSPNYRTGKSYQGLGGVAGNRTIVCKAQFKSLDTGTTTANHPLLLANARRTS